MSTIKELNKSLETPAPFAALRKQAANELEALTRQVETLERLDKSYSPCGHNAQYAYTENGGKAIVCLVCERTLHRFLLSLY